MKRLIFSTVMLLTTLCVGLAHAVTPLSNLSPEEQQELAQQLGAKVQRFEMWTDRDGHVTGLIFINHQSMNASIGEKPGINDSDLLRLTSFPRLTALNIEAQPVGESGLAVLKKFPEMKQLGFHYMAKDPGANVSDEFISIIDEMKHLEILEIKHNFRVKAINVESLRGPFPKLWSLVLDTPLTANQMMHVVKLCPNVRDLQLHRTDLSPGQLKELGALLPKLEVLWLKTRGDLQVGHLEALESFQKLRIFSPQFFKNALPFDGGWDALGRLPNLKRLEIGGSEAAANADAIKLLVESKPDLLVSPTLTRSRNYRGI